MVAYYLSSVSISVFVFTFISIPLSMSIFKSASIPISINSNPENDLSLCSDAICPPPGLRQSAQMCSKLLPQMPPPQMSRWEVLYRQQLSHVYIHIHTCICICILTYVYMHMYIQIYIYIYTHVHLYSRDKGRKGQGWMQGRCPDP